MFRRKNENYDEYNEKNNARYDDDYIRDEKEYRTECSHDHEQAYEDFNSEQQTYDQYNQLEAAFAAELEPGERILWCGEAEKKDVFDKRGDGCLITGIIIMAAFSIFFFGVVIALILGIILYLKFMPNNSGMKNRAYAVTDRNICLRVKNEISRYRLSMIESASFVVNKSNVGIIMLTMKSQGADMRGMGSKFMYDVKDPERVCRIVNDALAKYNESKGSVNNG